MATTAESKLTAANTVDSNASDLLAASASDNTDSSDTTNALGSSNSGNRTGTDSMITTSANKAVGTAKSFITQAIRQTVSELKLDTDGGNIKQSVSKLSSTELSALSSYSGISIVTDADLVKALGVSSQNLTDTVNQSSLDISIVDSIINIPEADETLTNLQSDALKTFPNIPELASMVADTYTKPDFNILDELGNSIPGIPTDADFTFVKSLTNGIKTFCSDYDLDMNNNNLMSNLYRALLALLASTGLAGLLSSLAACSDMFDTANGKEILVKSFDTIIGSGDTATASVISDILGPGLISYPEDKVKTLISNDTEDDVTNITNVINNLGIDKTSLVTNIVPDTSISAYSMEMIDTFSTNPDTMNYLIGEDVAEIYKTIQF